MCLRTHNMKRKKKCYPFILNSLTEPHFNRICCYHLSSLSGISMLHLNMVVGRLLVACGMNVGWTLAGRGLDTGWTCSGRVVLGQPTPSPPPVHVTACWTFNGPYPTVILLCRSQKNNILLVWKNI